MTKTQRFTLAATSLGLFMIYLDALIVNVALPAIQSDFKVGEAGLQWVVTAYSLGMTIAIMSSGTASGHLRPPQALPCRHRSLHGGLSGLRHGVLARSTQPRARGPGGCGSDGQCNVARACQRRISRSEVEGWAIGIWTAIASTAIAIGPTLGGFMVQRTGWRSIFMVNIPVGLVVLALTWRFVAESRDERPRKFDIPGQLLFMMAVGAFAFAVIEGPQCGLALGEDPDAVRGRGGGAGGIYLLRTQERGPDDGPEALRRPHVLARDHHDLRRLFAAYGMLLVITQYMQNVRGFSPTDAGFLLLPYSMSLMIVSLMAGKLVGVIGSRRLILLGIASQIVGFAVLIAGLQGSTVVVSVGLVFVGVGAGLCLTPITSLAMTAVPAERAGMASGIMSAQRALGSTVGFAVLGSILAATLTTTLSAHLADALPDPAERKEVADMIIGNANPRAYSAEIGPGRPIKHLNPATQKAILAVADSDFIEGIRFSLATAIVFLALVLAAGFVWFPRGSGSIADAEREARALASEETTRESPLS